MGRGTVKVMVYVESCSDINAHSLWKRETTVMFDMEIVNLNVGSYLRMMSKKLLEKAEKKMKCKYVETFLESRQTFIPMIY